MVLWGFLTSAKPFPQRPNDGLSLISAPGNLTVDLDDSDRAEHPLDSAGRPFRAKGATTNPVLLGILKTL